MARRVLVVHRMDLTAWIVVGLAAGGFAALVAGRAGGAGAGALLDASVGVIGALLGGWVFQEAGWRAPFVGLAGHISLAFAGAVVLVLALRVVRGPERPPLPSFPPRLHTHRSFR